MEKVTAGCLPRQLDSFKKTTAHAQVSTGGNRHTQHPFRWHHFPAVFSILVRNFFAKRTDVSRPKLQRSKLLRKRFEISDARVMAGKTGDEVQRLAISPVLWPAVAFIIMTVLDVDLNSDLLQRVPPLPFPFLFFYFWFLISFYFWEVLIIPLQFVYSFIYFSSWTFHSFSRPRAKNEMISHSAGKRGK